MNERTPRLVHIIWLGSEVPAQVDRLRDEVARHDPDVEVRVWRDTDLDWLENLEAFASESRYPAKADIARYEILLRHGGVYLDADMRVHGSLAPVFDGVASHGAVVARQSRTVYNNAFLAAAPGHRLLADLVSRIPAAYRWTGGMTAPATTGPHLLTERIMAFIRAGGELLELPQHAVYPWYADEDPLPDALVPPTTILSHDWASSRDGESGASAGGPVHVPDRRSRRERTGRTLRARLASLPLAHRAVSTVERSVIGARRPPTPATVVPEALATDASIDAWCARRIARLLRGSACLLDMHPATPSVALAATRVLDRPGRVMVAHDEDRSDAFTGLRDPSIRCTVHLIGSESASPDAVSTIRSDGSLLLARTISAEQPPLGAVHRPPDQGLADLIDSVPRYDMVRVRAGRLTEATAEVLRARFAERRIARLIITLDPFDVRPGTGLGVEMIERLEAIDARTELGPWLLDGRGRTWREHLRVAARPFLVILGL